MRGLLVVVLFLGAGCPKPGQQHAPPAQEKAKQISLFFVAELKGSIEPCGCTSDPWGDLARTAAVIADARSRGPVALFDGGSTLYSLLPLPPEKVAQEELKADLLAEQLHQLGLLASGLGPFDLAAGKDKVRLGRQAVNVSDSAGVPLEPPRVLDAGGVRVGVFGVVDPEALAAAGITAEEPAAAARRAIADLEGKGAQVIVCLAHMPRAKARRLAREAPGIDFLLVGQGAPDPDPKDPWPGIETVGTTHLLQPHNRGQSLARVDLTVDPTAARPLTDAIGEARAKLRIARLDELAADLEPRIAAWDKDPTAEPAFVQGKKDELAALRAERQELLDKPLRTPASGSWFTMQLQPIRRALPCDEKVQRAKTAFDVVVGERNRADGANEQPAPVPAGGAGYVGIDECGFCHKAAVDFWKGTKHAEAWVTLETRNKQWNRDCIGCHVTGWQEPGGSTMAVTDAYRDVQCETCHGPASLHVDADGKEKVKSLVLAPPRARCVACHSPEHSDTFDYDAYLRDVTGKGHGEAFRARLGDGATGAQLRKAALEKAGTGIGAGCSK